MNVKRRSSLISTQYFQLSIHLSETSKKRLTNYVMTWLNELVLPYCPVNSKFTITPSNVPLKSRMSSVVHLWNSSLWYFTKLFEVQINRNFDLFKKRQSSLFNTRLTKKDKGKIRGNLSDSTESGVVKLITTHKCIVRYNLSFPLAPSPPWALLLLSWSREKSRRSHIDQF